MNPDFIIFNGCSFTQGGGLENPSILNLYGYDLPIREDGREYYEIREQLRYSKLVSDYFKCNYVNLAESANSNENIFQKIFEYIENNSIELKKYKNINCFIQTTMSSRMFVKYKGEVLNINTFEKNNYPYTKGEDYDDLQKWYESYILNFYDEKFEAYKVKKQIYTIREYLKSKNIKSNFIIYSDIELLKILEDNDYIKFDSYNQLMDYAEQNKLRILDDVNNPDSHLSPKGHIEVSKILIKKLENG